MQVSLIERLASCLVEANDYENAAKVLASAKRPMARTSLSRAVVNSRLKFVSAQLALMKGKADGLSQLDSALKDFQAGSRWLYQLRLSDQQVMTGNVSGRQADKLYSSVLRDPTEREWLTDPFECLAFLTTPHVAALERWFETKLINRQYEKAIEVAELVRRHRFYSSLPLGGRLVSLRWIMEGPNESLTKTALSQRAGLLARFPITKSSLTERGRFARSWSVFR